MWQEHAVLRKKKKKVTRWEWSKKSAKGSSRTLEMQSPLLKIWLPVHTFA